MISNRQLYFSNLANTVEEPMAIEISRAEGMYLYAPNGKKYLDLLGGISVANLGHQNPVVTKAVKDQVDSHMHIMVYGEFIQAPQVKLAAKLSQMLGDGFESVYFGNSGAEANDGALKLAKRYTGRSKIVSFKNAYHGSTQGVLSVLGREDFKQAYRPLLPNVFFAEFNNTQSLEIIDDKTAAVIIEPIQGAAGYITPNRGFLQAVREKCTENGALLIFDEIQSGFGRTGQFFAFQKYGVKPDVVTMAKALGGGMPIGAFAAPKQIMDSFKTNPVLGHITTFGGHPVSCAAALASAEVLEKELPNLRVSEKEKLFRKHLVHPLIEKINGTGLMLSVVLKNPSHAETAMNICLENGLMIHLFLFDHGCLHISPPLIITDEQIVWASKIILEALNKISKK